MDFHFQGITLTPSLKDYAETKILKVAKYFKQGVIKKVHVRMNVYKDHVHALEITIPLGSFTLRAEEKTHDMYAAIDQAVDKLEKQIRKFKNKTHRVQKMSHIFQEHPSKLKEEDISIARVKQVELKPMSTEEAALQMELIDHDFYIFLNEITLQASVVYKRKDGKIGVIESI